MMMEQINKLSKLVQSQQKQNVKAKAHGNDDSDIDPEDYIRKNIQDAQRQGIDKQKQYLTSSMVWVRKDPKTPPRDESPNSVVP